MVFLNDKILIYAWNDRSVGVKMHKVLRKNNCFFSLTISVWT